jgi:DNA repair protein RecO (recombination protein O)
MDMSDLSQAAGAKQTALPAKRTTQTTGESDSAFVLHTYAYRETSLIVEAFTRAHGRVVLVAKGAKRPRGALRGMLNPFQGLQLTWFGKAELKTLKSAEQEKILPQLSGAALLSAFYLNELMLKLATREDPHEQLFDSYAATVQALATMPLEARTAKEIAPKLRQFEVSLLRELGYALQLRDEADSNAPIRAEREYIYFIERGPLPVGMLSCEPGAMASVQVQGKTLMDMSCSNYSDPQTLVQSKQLMRMVINHLLGEKVLHTRQLIREMR